MRLFVSAVLPAAALAALMLAASCSKGKGTQDSVALIVNGQAITQSQIDDTVEVYRQTQIDIFPERLFENGDEVRQIVALAMATNMLMAADIKSRGWQADSALVRRSLERYAAPFPSREAFLAGLAEMGASEESLRGAIEEKMLFDSLLAVATAAAGSAGESECFAHYEENKARYVEPGKARASHIVFMLEPTASDSQVQSAIVKANEALAKARGGANFDALVAEYSSAPKDGDMGWFKRGDLIPDIERKLFTMKKGEISDPVPSSMGIHILKKTDEEEPKQMSYAEAAGEIKKGLDAEKKLKAVNAYVDSLISAAEIQYIDTTLVMKERKGK
ncbi:MAG: peptidylprolyl isomerase [Chitinispirillales bacterium]|jgi:parvulin-like peptidyl-prolyl isomerase|nr:peptidylprolyl isomerase [Chitinispirillales bacterium]